MANFNRSKMGGGGRFGKKNFGGRDSRPQMHDAVCDKCGRRCQVPFRPTGERPVLCSDCFSKERDGMPQRNDSERNFDRRDSGRGNYEERRMYSATCSNCGKKCEVPFLPTGGRPTYCKECYDKGVMTTDSRHDDDRHSDRKHSDSRDNSNNNFKQFEALGAKLDKIISLLTAANPPKNLQAEFAKKEAEEVLKSEKPAKKAVKKVAAPKKAKKK